MFVRCSPTRWGAAALVLLHAVLVPVSPALAEVAPRSPLRRSAAEAVEARRRARERVQDTRRLVAIGIGLVGAAVALAAFPPAGAAVAVSTLQMAGILGGGAALFGSIAYLLYLDDQEPEESAPGRPRSGTSVGVDSGEADPRVPGFHGLRSR